MPATPEEVRNAWIRGDYFKSYGEYEAALALAENPPAPTPEAQTQGLEARADEILAAREAKKKRAIQARVLLEESGQYPVEDLALLSDDDVIVAAFRQPIENPNTLEAQGFSQEELAWLRDGGRVS